MWLPPTLVVTLGSTVQSPASCRSCRSLSGRMQSRCPCPSCEKARNADGTRADPAAATHGYHTSAPKHVPTPVTYALENGGDERLDGRVVQVLVSHPFIIHVVKPVCQKQRSHVIRRKVQVHSPCRVARSYGASALSPCTLPARCHTHRNVWRSVYLVRSTFTLGSFTYSMGALRSKACTSLQTTACTTALRRAPGVAL